jgi:hypothetical protein
LKSRRIRKAIVVLSLSAAALAPNIFTASPASAAFYGTTVKYGYFKSGSCNWNNWCSVTLSNGTIGQLRSYGPFNGPNSGYMINDAIASRWLLPVNSYVAVIYGGGGTGAINRH